MSGPLSRVLAAVDDGAATVAQVAARTDLPADTVRAALEALEGLGRIGPQTLPSGCAASGCGTCAVTDGCATGPVPLVLGRR